MPIRLKWQKLKNQHETQTREVMKKLIILLAAATVAFSAMPASAAPGNPPHKAAAIRHLKRANHSLHQRVKNLRRRLNAKHGHRQG